MEQRFFFCPMCGSGLTYKNQGERKRLTCSGCSYILYENPVVGVAAVVQDSLGMVFLGRRRGKSGGLWCIPCGYVEYDEDVYLAAVREFKEETNLDIKITGVFAVHSNFHNPLCHTVGIWFTAEVTGGELEAREDLDRAGYFPLDNLPPLAFPTDAKVLEQLKALQ